MSIYIYICEGSVTNHFCIIFHSVKTRILRAMCSHSQSLVYVFLFLSWSVILDRNENGVRRTNLVSLFSISLLTIQEEKFATVLTSCCDL